MLKNYFKIAIAVLRRRKFFTFISLFGISFTLTILLVLTAFLDKVVGDSYPDRKRDRSLYVTHLQESGKDGQSSSTLSYYFLNHFVGSLKTPVKLGISSGYEGTNTYVNNKKLAVNYKYTNADYWEIMEYDFTEGKAFSKQQIDNADKVAVISEDMKRDYFGDIPSVVGKYIEADNVKYRVIGVVKNVPITSYNLYSDIYLPYTVSKTDFTKGKGYLGDFTGVMLAKSTDDVPRMRDEYDAMMRRIPMESKQFNKMYSHAQSYIRSYVETGNESSSGVTIVFTAIVIFVLLVTVLPTLNLVNINITRIMERSSEIGVRKAFGASSGTLVYQFLVENIILTFLGGLIGVVLSFIAIQVLNSFRLIPNLVLSINFTVLGIGLLVCFFFGLLSGVYPAWRMSKLNVVTALKAQ
ncbi:putative ABC transport system permease protein [Mucilaginibacter lappiensis]|uniref:ABC transport system permease protein n=1 Tax=Mucilaginibacter lappiensis TaxID=354630 RepID=A0ABR6PK01_9SPHI|nr:ABC transporter permease [Mucilaginibacter lappiensis]MBB6110097.1 putative ABC transport system permease protein [Mucilaginibacter lappiensis]SIR53136.1 putative ABC transport system permease protein [Mucilaginibacter lappiensis]